MKKIKLEAKGRYSLTVLDSEKNVVKDKQLNNIENVVTYVGAFSFFFGDPFRDLRAAVGTGNVERVRSDTSLGAEDPGRSASSGSVPRLGNEVDNLDGTSTLSLTRTFEFSLGEKVGTFSEIGLFSSPSSSDLIAGQLIKDELGNPTTITLLSDEQLIVTYTIDLTVPNNSINSGTGTVTDAASNTYNYTCWAQPYFARYEINNSSGFSRYFRSTTSLSFFDSSGDYVAGLYLDIGNLWENPVHDGSGNVTITSKDFTIAPSDLSFSGAKWLALGNNSSSNIHLLVDLETNPKIKNNPSNTSAGSECPMLLEFSPEISKTSSQSFSIRAKMDFII